jgi:hypothetical protein
LWLGVRYVFGRLAAALRSMRILSKSQPQRPADAFLGLGVGTISQALTETDNAIKEGFDPASIPIERHRRLVCFWLHPDAQHKGDYEKPEAKEDFKKAESFFQVDINPLASNPLNLYDDVDNAFIVNLFKGSDKICFYVLSEFRKAINFNVTMLSVIFSLIVSVVAVLNILWSRSVDFYKLAFKLFGIEIQSFFSLYYLLHLTTIALFCLAYWRRLEAMALMLVVVAGHFFALAFLTGGQVGTALVGGRRLAHRHRGIRVSVRALRVRPELACTVGGLQHPSRPPLVSDPHQRMLGPVVLGHRQC